MELPTLTSPQHLWWLALVLPLLFWLAQPPRPRAVHWTAHRTQWLLAQAALRRRPPRFRALRWLLLSAAAIAVALAQTAPRGSDRAGPRKLTVLLDASASMSARTDGSTAYARAVSALRERLARLPEHVHVEVVRLGGAFERWRGAAARALASAGEPGGELPASWPALVAAARSDDRAVLVVSDGQGGALPNEVLVLRTGHAAANTALAVAAIDDRWPRPELGVRVQLRRFGPATSVELRASGAILPFAPRRVELAADGEQQVDFELQRNATGGAVVLQIVGTDDALAVDDRAELLVPPLPAPHIAVRGDDRGDRFVQRAAQALAAEVGGDVLADADTAPASFLLIEGGSASLQPGSVAMAAFGVRPPRGELRVWPAPTAIDWDRTEPLLRGLDLSELAVDRALADALPAGRAIVTATDATGRVQPLIVLVEGEHAASLHCAFRLQDSTLPLLPAFPQLLRRALLRGLGEPSVLVASPQPSLREADLRALPTANAIELPDFGAPGRDLGPWCLWCAALLLALRACLR